jgi:hypothetical protein
MILGMTGNRKGISAPAMETLVNWLDDEGVTMTEVHHGDCVGADKEFHDLISSRTGVKVVVHPPDNTAMRSFSEPRESRDGLGAIEIRAPKSYVPPPDFVEQLVPAPHPFQFVSTDSRYCAALADTVGCGQQKTQGVEYIALGLRVTAGRRHTK